MFKNMLQTHVGNPAKNANIRKSSAAVNNNIIAMTRETPKASGEGVWERVVGSVVSSPSMVQGRTPA